MLRIKDGFILKEVAGNFVIVPVGDSFLDFSSMITINESGAFLWNHLKNGIALDDLVKALTAEYDIDTNTAKKDIVDFIKILTENDIL